MEFKKISKVFLLAVVTSMIVIAIINICARIFVFDAIGAIIATIVFLFLTVIFTLLLLRIDRVSKWLDR